MVKIVKNPGNGRWNNLNDPNRPQCVKMCLCTPHGGLRLNNLNDPNRPECVKMCLCTPHGGLRREAANLSF